MSFAAKDLTSEESLNQKPLAFPRRNVGGNASQGPYRETLSRVVSIKNLSDGVESSYIGQQIIHTWQNTMYDSVRSVEAELGCPARDVVISFHLGSLELFSNI